MRRRRRGRGPRRGRRAAVVQLRRRPAGEHVRDRGRRGPGLPRLRGSRLSGAKEETVDPVQRNESEFLEHEAEPGADIIALPQLERLPPDPDGAELGGSSFTADNRSARLEALELVRAAVELADRIERDAQETAKDRLSRTEEEVRLRRLALDERETQLDHFKRELEGARQQLMQTEQELSEQRQRLSGAEAEAAAALASASERAEALNAEARAEADGILAAARSEAEAATAGIRPEAAAALDAARSEADGILATARTEADAALE